MEAFGRQFSMSKWLDITVPTISAPINCDDDTY